MKRILIVEDEFFLLESMIKFMEGLDNVRARGCVNLSQALESIEKQPPDLIFSDINLPDGSGLELISFLSNRDIHIPLIFVSAYISDYHNHIPAASNIMVLEKPVSMKRLRKIAAEKLAGDDGHYTFKLSDYLQIAAIGDHTVRLDCGIGTITMVKGQLWACRDGSGEGKEAFKRLVASAEVHDRQGKVVCKKIDAEEMGPSNITGSLDNLLLNAVFEEEQSLRFGEQGTSPVNFESLLEKGVEKLLSKQYAEALACFETARELQPDNRTVNVNIQRLNQLGYTSDKEAS